MFVTVRQRSATALLGFLLALQVVAPAAAVTTAREISDSRKIDREIDAEQGAVTDPLLSAWVNRIGARLWQHVRRTDVPYSVKILDSSEVNAFTTGGGYIYLDEGVLDTVGSDDELAGVMGHETGHDEHRHPITLRQRGEVLSVVFGLASLFSPALAALGSFAGEGVMAKTSRTDEYQADEEGVSLLTKAQFDPQAMTSLMRRLQQLEGDADAHIDKYLADHPGLPQRIGRLQRMAQIAAEARDPAVLREAGLRALADCRYAVAQVRLREYVKTHATDPQALVALGEVDQLLGQPARAAQSFTVAREKADPALRARIDAHIDELHHDERLQSDLPRPNLTILRSELVATRAHLTRSANAAMATQNNARATLASVQARLQRIEAIAPQLDDAATTEKLNHEIAVLGRTVNHVIDHAATVIDDTGTLQPGKETGLWADSLGITRDLAGTIANDDVPSPSRSLLASYGVMNDALRAADDDFTQATNSSYQALLELDRGLTALENLFHVIERQSHEGFGKDAVLSVKPAIEQAQLALAPSIAQGAIATASFNRGRSRQLQVRLDELNVAVFPDRQRGFETAVAQRVLSADGHVRSLNIPANVSVGEFAAARIIAADLGKDAISLLAEAQRTHRSVIDVPVAQAADAEALEIFLGLIYLDYTDDAALAEFPKTGSAH